MTKSKVCRKRPECFCLVCLMRSFTHDGTPGLIGEHAHIEKIRTAKTEPTYTCTKLRFMAKDDQEKNSNSALSETVEVSKNMTKRLI